MVLAEKLSAVQLLWMINDYFCYIKVEWKDKKISRENYICLLFLLL